MTIAGIDTGLRLDVSTFEILRHRLWYVNDEGALTISRLSGSPVATEVFDMNTGIMTKQGDLVYIDTFICAQATTLAAHVRYLLKNYVDNPGFNPGDVFLCNDPYVCVCHQNCVQVVGPVYWQERLVGWTGASLHVIDVGGPTFGQVQLDAADMYGEQPLIGPIKIVEGGRFRKDVETTYLRNSRLPNLLALDLRAKVAAVETIRRRLDETFREFGVDTVLAGMQDIIDYTERRLRARLRELPDGTWRHRGYIEFGDKIYDCHVTMTKDDDHLIFDFSESAEQAPAVINCAIHGLIGGVLGAVMFYLCWDIPWSPAGVERVVTVKSRAGTVVHASPPAGVSKSTTTAIWEVRNLACITLGKMLAASNLHRSHAMAGWQGVKALEELSGYDAAGERFGAPILDGMAGGGGALSHHDGIDTGGITSSLRATIANVESHEHRNPILFLYRRQTIDSGGPGEFRGGAGLSMLYMVHGVDKIPTKILHTFGVEQPESPGLCGGYPSTTNQFTIMRDSDVRSQLADGQVPQSLEELSGSLEVFGAYAMTSQSSDDVYRSASMGGGGYGDPIDRNPALVVGDIERSLVSPEWAERVYGVVLNVSALEAATGGRPLDLTIDVQATKSRRAAIRAERRQMSQAQGGAFSTEAATSWVPGRDVVSVGASLVCDLSVDPPQYRCRCGHELGNAEVSFKRHLAVARFPVQRIGPHVNPYQIGGSRFELREFYCPGCWTLLDVEIAQPHEPILDDACLSLDWLRRDAAHGRGQA